MGKIKCPHCGKLLEYQSTKDLPYFPFCRERCKLVDLGLWLDERHRISEDLLDQETPHKPDQGPKPEKNNRQT